MKLSSRISFFGTKFSVRHLETYKKFLSLKIRILHGTWQGNVIFYLCEGKVNRIKCNGLSFSEVYKNDHAKCLS